MTTLVIFVGTDVSKDNVPLKRRFLHQPHGVIIPKKTTFFIVTAAETSNLNIALTGWVL
jgi:hypothetical protein